MTMPFAQLCSRPGRGRHRRPGRLHRQSSGRRGRPQPSPGFDRDALQPPRQQRLLPPHLASSTRLLGTDGRGEVRREGADTNRTRTIAGVVAVVVRDVVRHPNRWPRPPTTGTPTTTRATSRYLGRDLRRHGNLEDREGSWEAAWTAPSRASVTRPTRGRPPRPGWSSRRARAEDQGLGGPAARGSTCPEAVVPRAARQRRRGLEPRVVSQKFYAAGLGTSEETSPWRTTLLVQCVPATP